MSMTPPIRMVSVPSNVLESIAFNLCSLHDFDPAFVQQNEKFALATITEYLRAQPTAAPVREEGGAVTGRAFKDQRAQKAYDLFLREGWMRGDIERFYRSGFAGVARPDERDTPREAVWLAGRDRAEAGLPHGIPDRPEFRNLIAALATREEAQAEAGEDERLTPDQAWSDLLEKDDRNSPEDQPDMLLITWDELADYMARAQPQSREEAQPIGLPSDEIEQVTKRFVIFTTPGEVPEKKGGWLKDEHLIDFLRAVMLHDNWKPGFRATVLELTWDNDLWASSATEYLEIHDDAIGPRRARKAWQAARDEHERIYKTAPKVKLGDEIDSYRRLTAISGSAAPEAEKLFDAIRTESWDLRCFGIPTAGGDDWDIGWRVVGHWQAEPCERTVAEVFSDDPAEAVRQALAALQTERKSGAPA
ncbi:hypothetical protein [Brevundimonas sp.]|uniref:hypothetical protein n=1 Tax=Brevundimonas sp. TaxID=1871086 RepID=UPI0028A2896B|nr:hypothetical protein [Brevundimonas sp.]